MHMHHTHSPPEKHHQPPRSPTTTPALLSKGDYSGLATHKWSVSVSELMWTCTQNRTICKSERLVSFTSHHVCGGCLILECIISPFLSMAVVWHYTNTSQFIFLLYCWLLPVLRNGESQPWEHSCMCLWHPRGNARGDGHAESPVSGFPHQRGGPSLRMSAALGYMRTSCCGLTLQSPDDSWGPAPFPTSTDNLQSACSSRLAHFSYRFAGGLRISWL